MRLSFCWLMLRRAGFQNHTPKPLRRVTLPPAKRRRRTTKSAWIAMESRGSIRNIPTGNRARSTYRRNDSGRVCMGNASAWNVTRTSTKFPTRNSWIEKSAAYDVTGVCGTPPKKKAKPRNSRGLGEVVQQIDSYMGSVHARPNIDDQSHTNATCYDCHNAHYITVTSRPRSARRRGSRFPTSAASVMPRRGRPIRNRCME